MIEFSEQDIARIEKIVFEYGTLNDNSRNQAIYRAGLAAGLAAGIERSAKVVEGGRFLTDTAPIKLWADSCAAAIRALLKEQK